MKSEFLDLLYKLKKEETFSEENIKMVNDTIEKLESASSIAEIKEIALFFIRLFLNHFNPDDWDIFK